MGCSVRGFQRIRRGQVSRLGSGFRRPSTLSLLLTAGMLLTLVMVSGSLVNARDPDDPGVTPAAVEAELDPGESVTAEARVRTPVVPPRPEVVLLVDGTESMEPAIENVRENLGAITGAVREQQPDSRFAVAAYGDAEVDGDRAFQVLQGLTYDVGEVQHAVDRLTADRGSHSDGPAEDWINALWQIGNGAGGATEFREGASPVVVLVGDASSHDPSAGHSLDDAVDVLSAAGVRVLGVDVETDIGDGLDGDGTGDWGDEPPHEPGQGTAVAEATGGSLFAGIDAGEVSATITAGLTNLPTTVGYETVACDPALSVTLDPSSQTVTSGETATFTETIEVADYAAQGSVLNCTVQFLLDGRAPNGEPTPQELREEYREHGHGLGLGVGVGLGAAVGVSDGHDADGGQAGGGDATGGASAGGGDTGADGEGGVAVAGAVGGAVEGEDEGAVAGVAAGAAVGVSGGCESALLGLAAGLVGGVDEDDNVGLLGGLVGGLLSGSSGDCGGQHGGGSDGGDNGGDDGGDEEGGAAVAGVVGGVIGGDHGGDDDGDDDGGEDGGEDGGDDDGGDDGGPDGDPGEPEPDPDFRQIISIAVNDVSAPVVTIDDRTVEAPGENGAPIDFTATAEDEVEGPLPVTCDPEPGSRFPVGTTEVTCTATDSSGNTGTDTATFTVLPPGTSADDADVAVTATVEPTPGYTGLETEARFTVTNAGPGTAENVVLETAWPTTADPEDRTLTELSGCTAAAPCAIPPGGRLVLTQTAVYDAEVTGTVRAGATVSVADPDAGDNETTARLRVLQPEVTVTPQTAEPGDVAIVRGEDFPAGSVVELSWEPGVTAARSPVVVASDGTFEAQMLILRRDVTGPRVLRAEVAGRELRGIAPLEEEVLVVQRNLQPPDFAGRG
jgi:hypothetical protein